MLRILFVCTGNTCRSPMAEAILRKIAQDEELEIEVRSAGVSAMNGSPASKQALQVLGEKGIRHSHRSRLIEPELVDWADLILTMTRTHKHFMIHDFPDSMEKVYTLKEYADLDPEKEALLRKLDRLDTELEAKRAEIQARFSLRAEDPWPEEAEQALRQEVEPLLKERKKLLKKMDESSSDPDISDPFGGSVDVYRQCADELEKAIRKIVQRWKREKRF
ncbi:low molecular weight protein arginine phosphatase [Lihuaxuella thermophila]|uniref:Protein-tyrosine phosphatase n=1 Tax=Lihuaxuella thermophila TaxID=1173111 RepID=A0A1H8BBG3_9BACL|nr:low molecular weight protein arginine phosphatase [Lihuaxuella thermophila]SEM80162.1 protein-tyrosine phosphatase [Lihuaxuella thermophila]